LERQLGKAGGNGHGERIQARERLHRAFDAVLDWAYHAAQAGDNNSLSLLQILHDLPPTPRPWNDELLRAALRAEVRCPPMITGEFYEALAAAKGCPGDRREGLRTPLLPLGRLFDARPDFDWATELDYQAWEAASEAALAAHPLFGGQPA
jgi:hypothetical protein